MTDVQELRAELQADREDYMIPTGDDLLWLAEQLVAWPHRRVHPDKTMNDSFLRYSFITLLDAAEARIAAEARVVKLCEALANMIPGPLCGDSFVPPIPDTKFLSLEGMTWGKLRRARQVLKEVGYVE